MIAADRLGLDQPNVEIGALCRQRERSEPAGQPPADDGNVAAQGWRRGHRACLAERGGGWKPLAPARLSRAAGGGAWVTSGRACGKYRAVPDLAPHIDTATPDDARAIAAIYAHHVARGTGSYDLEARSIAETAALIAAHRDKNWPFLVARNADGDILGYAYATQFRPRPAYAWACEDSIYIAPTAQGRGIGRTLLEALIVAATAAGFRTMVGVIGGVEPASIALHAACGFTHVGRLAGMGWKHGRWLDNVYMQRVLGDGTASPPETKPA